MFKRTRSVEDQRKKLDPLRTRKQASPKREIVLAIVTIAVFTQRRPYVASSTRTPHVMGDVWAERFRADDFRCGFAG
ncbi:hypothetical protein Aduo_011996 [Ancylostoma duodenale]